MKFDQIASAIRRIRQSKKMTLQQVSDRTAMCGKRKGTGNLSRIERNDHGLGAEGGGMRIETLLQICYGLDIEADELFREAREPGSTLKLTKRVRKVPVISWVQAGGWTFSPEQFIDAEEFVEIPTSVKDHCFGLKVNGDSMQSESGISFPEGCTIIVDPDKHYDNKSFVVAQIDGSDEFTFKQLIKDGSDCYLKPLNRSYKMLSIDKEVNIIGVVVAWSVGYTNV